MGRVKNLHFTGGIRGSLVRLVIIDTSSTLAEQTEIAVDKGNYTKAVEKDGGMVIDILLGGHSQSLYCMFKVESSSSVKKGLIT